MSTTNTLKNEHGISVPKRQGFGVKSSINQSNGDACIGINLDYTHKATGTLLRFTTITGYKDGAPYCSFRVYRFLDYLESNQKAISGALHRYVRRHNSLLKHGSDIYIGPGGALEVPIKNISDEDEFITLFRRTLPLIKSALRTIDPVWTNITEDAELPTKVSAVLVIDDVVDKYQELLHNEFNN